MTDITDKLADALEAICGVQIKDLADECPDEAIAGEFDWRDVRRAKELLAAYRAQRDGEREKRLDVHLDWTYSTSTEDGVYLYSKDCCTDEAQAEEVEVSGGVMLKHGEPVEIEPGGIWMRKPLAKGEG